MTPRHFLIPVLALIISFFAILGNSAHAETAKPDDNIVLRLLPEKTSVKSGDTITVGVEQKIRDGWHIYWINAGDSGTPSRITWSGVEGLKAAPIQWPVPKKLPLGPLVNFGYEGAPVLLQQLTLPADLPKGAREIKAKVDVLVCHDICIPETHTASFTINGGQDASAGSVTRAQALLPVEMGWPATYTEKDGKLIVRVPTDMPSAFADKDSIELFPEEWGLILNTENTKATKDGNTLILTHARGERDLSDAPLSKMIIAYKDSNGIRKAVRVSAASEGAVQQNGSTANPESINFAAAILLALLGGMILNLMPCVFPVLSMKALSLAQLKDKEIGKARMQGAAFTAGVIACFAIIAGVLLLLKSAGLQVGWGFQLQHPSVILFLAYLFFALGLNLAGYFEIGGRFSNIGEGLTRKSGMTGSFFTGALATLVATPCTAPFMGAAMGYALTQPAYISMSVFLALGVGLALPYLLLCTVPALRHLLPRPGAWMETFRQFLAFPMFASACWLVWVLAQQIGHMQQFAALLGMLAMALGIWFLKSRPRNGFGHMLFLVAAIASFAFMASTFFTVREEPVQSEEQKEAGDAESFTRSKLDAYLKGKEPVFVNMTAAWCITCKVNEKVALATDSTKGLFKEGRVKYLKGDWTNQNPEITHFLEEFGRSGVPIYVYYAAPDRETGARPAPVVLPQILTQGIVADALKNDTKSENP